jgi:hypothetical protein
LVATVGFMFDLTDLLHGFSWGKYVDPFGFRRLDALIQAGVGSFMGVNLGFRHRKSRGIRVLNFGRHA